MSYKGYSKAEWERWWCQWSLAEWDAHWTSLEGDHLHRRIRKAERYYVLHAMVFKRRLDRSGRRLRSSRWKRIVYRASNAYLDEVDPQWRERRFNQDRERLLRRIEEMRRQPLSDITAHAMSEQNRELQGDN